jgi:hypothetical protein
MEKVYVYKQIPMVFMSLLSVALAAAWVAFVYLALPKIWELSSNGLIPYSWTEMASWDDSLAWGMAAFFVVIYGVVMPLVRMFGVQEVGLSERGVIFRGREGKEKSIIRDITAIKSIRWRATRIEGLSPQGKKLRKVVRQGMLGKEKYRDFKEELHRLFSAGEKPS